MDKTRIGGNSDAVNQLNYEFDRANTAGAELTMMRRRIRTFFLEISEVSFPEDAPAWAPDWVEWLQTGEVAPVEVVEVEVVEEVGLSAQEVADEAGIVVERVTTEEIDSDAIPDAAADEPGDDLATDPANA